MHAPPLNPREILKRHLDLYGGNCHIQPAILPLTELAYVAYAQIGRLDIPVRIIASKLQSAPHSHRISRQKTLIIEF